MEINLPETALIPEPMHEGGIYMVWIVALFAWVLIEAIFMCIVTVAGRADDRMERLASMPETHESPQPGLLTDPSLFRIPSREINLSVPSEL